MKINIHKLLEYSFFGIAHIFFGLGFLSINLFASIIQAIDNIFNCRLCDNELLAFIILIIFQIIYITLKCVALYIIYAFPDIFKYINIILNKFLNDRQYKARYLRNVLLFDIVMFLIGISIYIFTWGEYNLIFGFIPIMLGQLFSLGGITISYLLFAIKQNRN